MPGFDAVELDQGAQERDHLLSLISALGSEVDVLVVELAKARKGIGDS